MEQCAPSQAAVVNAQPIRLQCNRSSHTDRASVRKEGAHQSHGGDHTLHEELNEARTLNYSYTFQRMSLQIAKYMEGSDNTTSHDLVFQPGQTICTLMLNARTEANTCTPAHANSTATPLRLLTFGEFITSEVESLHGEVPERCLS